MANEESAAAKELREAAHELRRLAHKLTPEQGDTMRHIATLLERTQPSSAVELGLASLPRYYAAFGVEQKEGDYPIEGGVMRESSDGAWMRTHDVEALLASAVEQAMGRR